MFKLLHWYLYHEKIALITILIYILHLFIIGLISWFVYTKIQNNSIKIFYFPALAFKLLIGIGIGVLFKYIYGYGDTLGFDADTLELVAHIKSYPSDFFRIMFLSSSKYSFRINDFFPRFAPTYFFLKICIVFYFLSNNSYWLTGLYLSLFSFLGLWSLVSILVKLFPKTNLEAALAFLFFPSIVFWSTGMMKESVVVGSVGFIVAIVIGYFRNLFRLKWFHFVGLVMFSYLLLIVKFYYFIMLIPILLIGYLWLKTDAIKWYVKLTILISGMFVSSFFLGNIHKHLNLNTVTGVMVKNHNDIYGLSFDRAAGGNLTAKGMIMYNHLNNSKESIIANLPTSMFASVYSPLPFDAANPFQLLFSLENLFVLFLSLYCFQKALISKCMIQDEALLCLIYVSLLGVCMALVSPNMGTLARYRIGYMPFFVYLLFVYSGVLKLIPFSVFIKSTFLKRFKYFENI